MLSTHSLTAHTCCQHLPFLVACVLWKTYCGPFNFCCCSKSVIYVGFESDKQLLSAGFIVKCHEMVVICNSFQCIKALTPISLNSKWPHHIGVVNECDLNAVGTVSMTLIISTQQLQRRAELFISAFHSAISSLSTISSEVFILQLPTFADCVAPSTWLYVLGFRLLLKFYRNQRMNNEWTMSKKKKKTKRLLTKKD